jgi:hypothetical protein
MTKCHGSACARLCRPQRLPAALLLLQRTRRGAQRARFAAAPAPSPSPSPCEARAAGRALLGSRLRLPSSLLRRCRLPLRLLLPPGSLLRLLA